LELLCYELFGEKVHNTAVPSLLYMNETRSAAELMTDTNENFIYTRHIHYIIILCTWCWI